MLIRIKNKQLRKGKQPEAYRLVQPSSSIRANFETKIGVDRCKSVQISTISGIKVRANECECGQKIGSIQIKSDQKTRVKCDQMLPNATRIRGLTPLRLILLKSLFMLCC